MSWCEGLQVVKLLTFLPSAVDVDDWSAYCVHLYPQYNKLNIEWIVLVLFIEITLTSNLKGKGKVVPVLLTKHHAMKAYWGSGGIAPLIL
jgi:hypothetical protein